MTRRNRGPRAGFTLVEILIVIAIIALLVALLIPTVGKVREGARRATCASEIAQINSAIAAYKQEMNVTYIPCVGGGPNGTFRLQAQYPVTPGAGQAGFDSYEAKYLKQVFRYLDLNNTGLQNVNLDANQTLVFFLTGGTFTNFQGFSRNKTAPFSAPTGTEDRLGPYIEFPVSKYATGVSVVPGVLVIPGISVNGDTRMASLLDVWGTPYAYFTFDPNINNYFDPTGKSSYPTPSFTAANPEPPPPSSTVSPYLQTTIKAYNAKGVQIISAGSDRLFGPGGTNWTPGSGVYDSLGIGGDDMSNFNNGPLAAQD